MTAKGQKMQCCQAYPEPGPILMCWQAFWPKDIEDLDVVGMSFAWDNEHPPGADRDAQAPVRFLVQTLAGELEENRAISLSPGSQLASGANVMDMRALCCAGNSCARIKRANAREKSGSHILALNNPLQMQEERASVLMSR